MKYCWCHVLGLLWHSGFLTGTIVGIVNSIPFVKRVPLLCLDPWFCNMGMSIGNVMIISHLLGKMVCDIFNGKEINVSLPGCGASLVGILAGASYIWGLFIISNGHPDYCHNEIPQILWTMIILHLINGLLHVLAFLIMCVIRFKSCCNKDSNDSTTNTLVQNAQEYPSLPNTKLSI